MSPVVVDRGDTNVEPIQAAEVIQATTQAGLSQWIGNGLNVATFVIVAFGAVKLAKWTGVVETRITNLEGWLGRHVNNHPGG